MNVWESLIRSGHLMWVVAAVEEKLPDPIKIAVLSGTQKLRLKIKEQEELAGPKVGRSNSCVSSCPSLMRDDPALAYSSIAVEAYMYNRIASCN